MTERDITVVAIDDHPVVLGGLQEALSRQHGIEFRGGFATVEQALESDAADVTVLDLVLADEPLPSENVRRLLEHGGSVIIYTQGSRPAWMADALMAGASGMVLKSAPILELVTAIQAASAGRMHLLPELALRLRCGSPPRPQLARREVEVLRLAASGLLYHQIADQLGITRETVKTYVKRIRAKYAAEDRDGGTRLKLRDLAVQDGYWEPPSVVETSERLPESLATALTRV